MHRRGVLAKVQRGSKGIARFFVDRHFWPSTMTLSMS
jgi:hypothetical protein